MDYGNTAVIFMVIMLVSIVLGITFTGMYYLNKDVNKDANESAR